MKTYHYLSEGDVEVTLSADAVKEIREIKFIPARICQELAERISDQTVITWLRRMESQGKSLDFTVIVGKDAKRAYKELTAALKDDG